MAGVIAACKKTGQKLSDQMIVISGAGAGGAGVAWVLREGMIREGLTPEEARARVMVLDSTGLLFHGRKGMEDYKLDSAQTPELAKSFVPDGGIPNLLQTIVGSKCTCLIGLPSSPPIALFVPDAIICAIDISHQRSHLLQLCTVCIKVMEPGGYILKCRDFLLKSDKNFLGILRESSHHAHTACYF